MTLPIRVSAGIAVFMTMMSDISHRISAEGTAPGDRARMLGSLLRLGLISGCRVQ